MPSIKHQLEFNALKFALSLLLLFCSALARADHLPGAEWSWHLLSAGGAESRTCGGFQ